MHRWSTQRCILSGGVSLADRPFFNGYSCSLNGCSHVGVVYILELWNAQIRDDMEVIYCQLLMDDEGYLFMWSELSGHGCAQIIIWKESRRMESANQRGNGRRLLCCGDIWKKGRYVSICYASSVKITRFP